MARLMSEAELAAKNARNRKAWTTDAIKPKGPIVQKAEYKQAIGPTVIVDCATEPARITTINLKPAQVAHVSKTGKVGKFRPIPSVVKPSKYKNKKTEVDGILFDSKKEAARWLELKALEASNRIAFLRRQVRVPLIVGREVIAHWVADFEYYESHDVSKVWEDVKSDYTRKLPVYRLKKKLVKAIYGVDIKET